MLLLRFYFLLLVYNEIMSLYSYYYYHPQTSTITHDHRVTKILIRLVAVMFSLFIVLSSNLFIKILETNYVSPVSAFTPNEVLSESWVKSKDESKDEVGPNSFNQFQLISISLTPTPSPSSTPTPTFPAPNVVLSESW